MKKIRLVALLLTLSSIIGLFAACSSNGSIGAKTIDVKDYITINYGKYNGNSEPTFDVDYYSMSAAFDTEKLNKYIETLPESVQFEFIGINSYAHFFNFDFREDYKNISNGDTVIIDVTFDSYLPDYGVSMEDFCKHSGIILKETTLEYTVSGLEELPDMIDVFEGVEQYIQYSGANGYGSYYDLVIADDYMRQEGELYFVRDGYTNAVKVLLNNKKIAEILYFVEAESNLSAGDIITLKAQVTACADTVEENGVVFLGTYACFKQSSTEVTVPDLGKYLTTVEEFTPDVIGKIKAYILEEYEVIGIEKMYFTTFLPGVESPYNVPVFIMVIVNDKRNLALYEYYYIDYVENIILMPDGEVKFGYDDESYPRYDDVQAALDDFEYDSFVYTELPLY